jgi:hypothetical protein
VAASALVLLLLVACKPPLTARPPEAALHPPSAASPEAGGPSAGASPDPPRDIKAPMAGDPDAAALGEARLVTETCEENEARVRERVDRMRAEIDQNFEAWKAAPSCDEFGSGGGRGEGIGLGEAGGVGQGRGAAVGFSRTNNQVEGVDEADIVKTDGTYLYVAANGALRIVRARGSRLLSATRLGGDVRDILLERDRAVAFVATGGAGTPSSNARRCTYAYDCQVGGDGSRTTIVVIDVSDRARPRVVRRIELSGSLVAARRIEHTVHTVVADGDAPEDPYYLTWPQQIPSCRVKGMDSAAVRVRFTQLMHENERRIRASVGFPTIAEGGAKQPLCRIMRSPLGDGRAFTTLVSFDLRDDAAAPSTATVQSRPGPVFVSEHAVYLAVPHSRSFPDARWYSFLARQDEISEIHKFAIGAAPTATRYLGSGLVPGHVLNQYAMDEWCGYLRAATTRGRVPDPAADSAVSVLAEADGGNLVRVGAVDRIAPGEDIRAVRFDGDRAYVVTFKKTDPLFVLDLSRPASPAILGELKIPGFSTYLHRVDKAHLLSIGFDAQDHGDFAFFDGVLLQLFDVTNPTEPRLLHREKIGTRGSSSEAATDSLAFNYFDERKLLAVPMTVCEGGGDGTFGRQLAFSGLLVYEVTLESGFRRLGGVSHGPRGASCDTWWSQSTSRVKRSVFIDDLVFSIATDRMKVQRLSRLGVDVGDVPLAP